MLSNTVSEIMSDQVITAEASSMIFTVMELMAAKNVGRVVITDKRAPVGIFTEKDVLRRVMNKKIDPKKTTIRRVMTSPLRAVQRETHIIEALGKMYRGKFRHLLVCGEKGMIVGIISMRRILRLAVELGQGLQENRSIGSIMSGKPVAVDPRRSIHSTIDTMIREDSGCVVVVSGGEPKGIFTERDVLRRVAVKKIDTRKTAIQKVLTTDLITAPRSALTGEVLAEMYKGDFRHMPILGERGELVGLVSMADILQYARALDIDESVRKAWKEIEKFWESEEQYTPG
ncbi:MAG: CBS domain-containing protein [Deltaproteobacteria bacterium]|nr:CBS domain-containing protein [Deltaproteobacteria bacterium]